MSARPHGWIGVDLDGTLAEYTGWVSAEHIGLPVPLMVKRVQDWLTAGYDVRVFTARVWPIVGVISNAEDLDAVWTLPAGTGNPARDLQRVCEAQQAAQAILTWCEKYVGAVLPITCTKDYGMVELWDDRAVRIERNTGLIAGAPMRPGMP